MNASMHRGLRPGGFTLIELVTVIIIIGVLGAIAAPKFFSGSAFSSRGYADELAAALSDAQKVAVASGCPVQITISTSGYQATQRGLTGDTCQTSGAWSVPVLRADGTPLAGTPPGDANVSTSVTLVFDAAGASNASASFNVGSHAISVNAVTGFIGVNP